MYFLKPVEGLSFLLMVYPEPAASERVGGSPACPLHVGQSRDLSLALSGSLALSAALGLISPDG